MFNIQYLPLTRADPSAAISTCEKQLWLDFHMPLLEVLNKEASALPLHERLLCSNLEKISWKHLKEELSWSVG